MRPIPPTNIQFMTYSPLMLLVTKQSQIHGKSYSQLDLQLFKFLFASLGPGFFLPLTQGKLSRFCFPDHFIPSHFSTNSPQISPRMDHKWNTNSSWTHYVIWVSPDVFLHETHERSEVLTCQNTIILLKKESQKSGLSNGRFLQFCKIPPEKVISNLKLRHTSILKFVN